MSNPTASVCRTFPFLIITDLAVINTGCMESLVRYKILTLRKHPSTLSREEKERLLLECTDLLSKLEGIDTLRRRRYQQAGNACSLVDCCFNMLRHFIAQELRS